MGRIAWRLARGTVNALERSRKRKRKEQQRLVAFQTKPSAKKEEESSAFQAKAGIEEEEISVFLFKIMLIITALLLASGVSWMYVLSLFLVGLYILSMLFEASKSAKAKADEIKQKETETARLLKGTKK